MTCISFHYEAKKSMKSARLMTITGYFNVLFFKYEPKLKDMKSNELFRNHANN